MATQRLDQETTTRKSIADRTLHDTEATPLISGDVPAESSILNGHANLVSLCALLALVVNIGTILTTIPTIQIIEHIVCHDMSPDLSSFSQSSSDPRCKELDVQGELAEIRGWSNAIAILPSLLVSIPYGILADRFGRRPVLRLSVLGISLMLIQQMIILAWPNAIPVKFIVSSGLFLLVGGGPSMLIAMLMTMLADTLPVSQHTTVFSYISGISLIAQIFVTPLAAFFMSFDPWIPMWLGSGLIIIGNLLALLFPETKSSDQRSGERTTDSVTQEEEEEESNLLLVVPLLHQTLCKHICNTIAHESSHIWLSILCNRAILPLLLGFVMTQMISYTTDEMLLQYSTKRFDWKWETATYISTAGSLTTLASLCLLPYLTKNVNPPRLYFTPPTHEIFFMLCLSTVMMLGHLFLALSSKPWLLILGLALSSMGEALSLLCRAMLNSLVDAQFIALLNTAIATMEQLATLVSAPLFSYLLRSGFELGGAWISLPYFLSAATAGIIVALTLIHRVPRNKGEREV
ncbi:major facilitator superfamily domain-containing protein [Aspergillus granulosus]|uniref:Major facilitator superfamily domain-containing protein n=1 Tax=Aspergillus granulosus TaxID=176169 RepID=A0ABR4HY48_9EURO